MLNMTLVEEFATMKATPVQLQEDLTFELSKFYPGGPV